MDSRRFSKISIDLVFQPCAPAQVYAGSAEGPSHCQVLDFRWRVPRSDPAHVQAKPLAHGPAVGSPGRGGLELQPKLLQH